MTKVKHITRIAYKVPPTGFSTFDVEYYLSTSTTTLAGGSWQTTPPTWIEGRYMWTRTKVVMTDGTTTYSDPVCIGGTGRGIQSIQEQYYLSTSNSTQTGGSWANSPQAWVDGKYMWTRSVITYTDGTVVTTDPVCVTGGKGATGQSSFKSIVFKRSNSTPSTPTGGSYASPVPSGWSDGIPSGDAQLWMSTRIFTSDGESPQQSAWTTPQAATDTADIDFEYSSYDSPGTPATQPSRWHNTAADGDIWMAVRKCKNGTWGSWEVFRIKGEQGDPGQSSFKSIVFKRSNSTPSTPTGGSYASPVPSGWSDGVPSGDAQLWMSTRVFTSNGESPQQSAWTTPQAATDTADIDFEYSSYDSPGTPATQPSRWHNAAAEGDIWMAVRKCKNGTWGSWEVFKIKGEQGNPGSPGDPGTDGQSFVPVYRNLDTQPAKPTGVALPPQGWREDVANSVTITSIQRSDLSTWDFELNTVEAEYGLQYYALPGAGNDNADSVAIINFTTAKANQQLNIAILASSEANYDCIMVGQPDSASLPVRTNSSTYLAKASGNNVAALANVIIQTPGSHFIYVAYRKDGSTTSYNDFGYFRIADLPETLWMSIATMRGNTVLSWSDPIKMTAGRGERGAIPRMRTFAEGLLFMEGKAGEAYLDFAFFNNRYYRCTKTHVAQVGETPYAAVQAGSGLWALENDYQFIASKVMWVGTGSQGWLIDEGRIYHSSGLIELNADGSIQTSNGKFKLTKEGAVKSTDGEFEGTIKANIFYHKVSTFLVTTGATVALPDDVGQIVIVRLQGATGTAGGVTLPAASAVAGQTIDIFCYMASNMGCYLYPKSGDSLVKYDYSTSVAGCDIRYKYTKVYSDGTRWIRLVYVDSF